MITERNTKYAAVVREYLASEGHATNLQLLLYLRAAYPEVSATTVHRITARLVGRGELRLAPSAADGAMRFDANNVPHDHFQCTCCGRLRDANIRDQIRPIIEQAIGDGCSISGRLVISGLCKNCVGNPRST